MRVTILGIDPGLEKTGFALLHGSEQSVHVDKQTFGVIQTPKWADRKRGLKYTDRERADWIGHTLLRVIADAEPAEVAIEDFVYMGRRGGAENQMPMLVEHVRMVGLQAGTHVTVYTNGEWKTKTLRCRTANKLQVQHYVKKQLPKVEDTIGTQPDHVWDAIGIAYCRWRELLKGDGQSGNRPPANIGRIRRGKQ